MAMHHRVISWMQFFTARSADTLAASLNGRFPKLSDTAHSFIFDSQFLIYRLAN
jgi:hypothetical protein